MAQARKLAAWRARFGWRKHVAKIHDRLARLDMFIETMELHTSRLPLVETQTGKLDTVLERLDTLGIIIKKLDELTTIDGAIGQLDEMGNQLGNLSSQVGHVTGQVGEVGSQLGSLAALGPIHDRLAELSSLRSDLTRLDVARSQDIVAQLAPTLTDLHQAQRQLMEKVSTAEGLHASDALSVLSALARLTNDQKLLLGRLKEALDHQHLDRHD